MNQPTITKAHIEEKFNAMVSGSTQHYTDYFKRFRYIFNYLDAKSFNTALERAQFIEDHFAELPAFFAEEWFELLTADEQLFAERVKNVVAGAKHRHTIKN